MKIINNTRLSYKILGDMIDQILKIKEGSTNYFGKIETCEFETKFRDKQITVKVQIRYLKSFVEWRFDEK